MKHTKTLKLLATAGLLLKSVYAGDGCKSGRHCQCCDQLAECYSENSPWGQTGPRPIRSLPNCPNKIEPEFHLFTLRNRNSYVEFKWPFSPDDPIPFEFHSNQRTVFIVHGFLSNGDDNGWMGQMKNKILDSYDYNVVLVDWKKGANVGVFNLDYPKAAQNTRVVGDVLGQLVQYLEDMTGMDTKNVHCIGHSLGAHVCGYAGKVEKLGRISGLDPAGPYFENTPDFVRLDKTDADFVDNLHTDGEPLYSAGFGMLQAIGDADFYPNGGKDQPGCRNLSGCSHGRSHEIYVDSITQPGCVAEACASYDDFKHDNCWVHSQDFMGWHADENRESGMTYYLDTKKESPWCV